MNVSRSGISERRFALCFLAFCGDFFVGGPSPFRSLPGPTHFSLSCQRKVSKRKARPRWRPPPWIFVAGRGRSQTRCAQTRLLPFSSPQQKSKAPSRAQRQKKKGQPRREVGLVVWAGAEMVWPLTFLPLMAPSIFASGRKKGGELFERSEFSPPPPGYGN